LSFHQEGSTEKCQFRNYSGNICLHFFALHFQFSVIWSEMQFGVITSKHGLAYNPTLHSGCLNFVLISWFVVEYAEHQIHLLPRG